MLIIDKKRKAIEAPKKADAKKAKNEDSKKADEKPPKLVPNEKPAAPAEKVIFHSNEII